MIVSLAARTSSGVDATPCLEIRTGATPGRVKILEIGLFLAEATATTIGIGRPAAIGVPATIPVDFLPEDPNDVLASGVVWFDQAWVGPPTIPVDFLRRISLPATIGTGVIFSFPKGLTLPVSGGLVLWNLGTNSLLDCHVVAEI